jgi:trans-2,3-dihydro-3-hydroxyanthranilate isomerase
MSRELHYSVLDVFAERPLEGNALAVFHDGRDLSTEQMQAIAREMNLSETTFVIPANDAELERRDGVRVRIFTTQEELPFAGHPTLGTASWLHRNYAAVRGAAELKLKLNIGAIPVTFAETSDRSVLATMRQNDPVFGAEYERAEVAEVLGLGENDLLEDCVPQTVSTGNAFCIVALRPEALTRLAIPQAVAGPWLRERGARWFYCIAPAQASGPGEPAAWRARMQFYSGEDPATGSAAGPCIAWLVRHGYAPSAQPVVLFQGAEIGRPSRLTAQATRDGERVHSVLVSGRTIPVANGTLLPSF